MAQITKLQISDFRNLPSVAVQPSEHFNVFYGHNGAGKTSLLEAIYYFGFGRSFRTNNSAHLVQKDCERFTLCSQLHSKDNKISVGVEYGLDGGRRIRCDGNTISSISAIAELLPIQLISTDSYRYFHDGPKLRRQFMNWGLFHVEPLFFPLWQRLLQLLKQRNAALKARLPKSELSIWNTELIDLAEKIDDLRQKYVSQLQPLFETLLSKILDPLVLKLNYSPGWKRDIPFEEALNQQYFKDQALGYTSVGPHRADLQLLLDDKLAGEILSQGQQKLTSCALYLAQGQLLKNLSGKSPIYLIDDLPSELDPKRRSYITTALTELNAQVFITGLTEYELCDAIALKNSQLFHVEQNDIQRME